MVKVSVLMPVYNCVNFIYEAVESMLVQTFTDFELLVIDDASDDGTYEEISRIKDKRIKLFRKQQNTGYTDSLNFGLSIAKGKYIARMDGDDISLPTRIQKQVDFLDNHLDVDVCGTFYEIFPNSQFYPLPTEYEEIKLTFLDWCALGHPTVMYRNEFIKRNKLQYNSQFEPSEDYELWTRMVKFGRLANIPEVLLMYRVHQNQISNVKTKLQIENSFFAKLNMLELLLDIIDEKDERFARVFFGFSKVETVEELTELLTWLDVLKHYNELKKAFIIDKFKKYLTSRERTIVRDCILNKDVYCWKFLFNFLRYESRLRGILSKRDYIVVIIKSLIGFRR